MINDDKLRGKKWEELTDEEKKEFEELGKKPIIKLWFHLTKINKCWMCKTKFPEGIVNKIPYDSATSLMSRIKGDFLFHMYTTHALNSEDVADIFSKVILDK